MGQVADEFACEQVDVEKIVVECVEWEVLGDLDETEDVYDCEDTPNVSGRQSGEFLARVDGKYEEIVGGADDDKDRRDNAV